MRALRELGLVLLLGLGIVLVAAPLIGVRLVMLGWVSQLPL